MRGKRAKILRDEARRSAMRDGWVSMRTEYRYHHHQREKPVRNVFGTVIDVLTPVTIFCVGYRKVYQDLKRAWKGRGR